jgi:hypothetical protein
MISIDSPLIRQFKQAERCIVLNIFRGVLRFIIADLISPRACKVRKLGTTAGPRTWWAHPRVA